VALGNDRLCSVYIWNLLLLDTVLCSFGYRLVYRYCWWIGNDLTSFISNNFLLFFFCCIRIVVFVLCRWGRCTKTAHVGEYGLYTGTWGCMEKIDKMVLIAEWPGRLFAVDTHYMMIITRYLSICTFGSHSWIDVSCVRIVVKPQGRWAPLGSITTGKISYWFAFVMYLCWVF